MQPNSNPSPQLLPMPCYTKAGIWKTKVEKRSISLLLYNVSGLAEGQEFLLQMLNRITMDLRTELLKFLDYYENVHNDGNWSFDNVVDKYIESQHDGKPT